MNSPPHHSEKGWASADARGQNFEPSKMYWFCRQRDVLRFTAMLMVAKSWDYSVPHRFYFYNNRSCGAIISSSLPMAQLSRMIGPALRTVCDRGVTYKPLTTSLIVRRDSLTPDAKGRRSKFLLRMSSVGSYRGPRIHSLIFASYDSCG